MRLFLSLFLLVAALPALAQQPRTVVLTGWSPEDAADRIVETDVLPFIDTLAVDYAYGTEADRPWLQFGLTWVPGPEGLVDGERRPYEELPDSTFMVALEASADVYSQGRRASRLYLRVDSMMLAPSPGAYAFEVNDVPWGDVFEGTSARRARALFADGFDLRDLRIESVAFASYGEGSQVAEDEDDERPPHVVVRRPPRRVGIYTGRPHIFVDVVMAGWTRAPRRLSGSEPRGSSIGRGEADSEPDRDGTRGRPRGTDAPDTGGETSDGPSERGGERVAGDSGTDARSSGRSTRGRSGKGAKAKDDDDDDDDSKLGTTTALVAAAAIVGVAYAGGSVGPYVHGEAPVGLAAGLVRPNGGVLLHAGVNADVLSDGDDPRLVAGLLGFRDVARSPFQPAFGFGVRATDLEADDLDPSLSLGLAVNLRQALLLGTYDVAQNSFGFGFTFNVRSRAQP